MSCKTRCEVDPGKRERSVCEWCDSMRGNRNRKPRWRQRLMVDAEWLRASCEDVGDLMHRAGPSEKLGPVYLSVYFRFLVGLRLTAKEGRRGRI